ncbi:MAG: response regulator, partial [Desulfobacterales bacterium]|nr:response regulator [Desulfobacterales bacterium]
MADETILLVDDEADIREVLSIALEDMGYTVLVAENGADALELFRENAPTIVLTDIKMPRMDGIELLRRIKSRNPEAEVVMITGHGDMDLAVRSLKNEATDFITKPINVDALEISLNRARERILTREKLKQYTENLETLVQEKTELQGRLSSLGLMIGSISHGIKGLLTGLDGGLYLLESGLKKEDNAQVDEGLNTVRLMVERIRKMIMDILHYAKERDLNLERVDVADFAGEVARVVASKAARRQIEFDHHADPDLGFFVVDEECIHSALINILENAIDACLMDASSKP